MGQALLDLGGPGAQDRQRPLPGGLDPGQPERGLADSSLSLEHDCSRPLARPVQEGAQLGDLVFPADDLLCHLASHAVTMRRAVGRIAVQGGDAKR